MKKIILTISLLALTSCGTIVNDPNVPVALSFSDGSEGTCKLNNKRASYSVDIPSTTMVRRSDDALRFDCESENGKKRDDLQQAIASIKPIDIGLPIEFINFRD